MSGNMSVAEVSFLEDVLINPDRQMLYLSDPQYHALVTEAGQMVGRLNQDDLFAHFVRAAFRDRLTRQEAEAARGRIASRDSELERLQNYIPGPQDLKGPAQ